MLLFLYFHNKTYIKQNERTEEWNHIKKSSFARWGKNLYWISVNLKGTWYFKPKGIANSHTQYIANMIHPNFRSNPWVAILNDEKDVSTSRLNPENTAKSRGVHKCCVQLGDYSSMNVVSSLMKNSTVSSSSSPPRPSVSSVSTSGMQKKTG